MEYPVATIRGSVRIVPRVSFLVTTSVRMKGVHDSATISLFQPGDEPDTEVVTWQSAAETVTPSWIYDLDGLSNIRTKSEES